MLDTQKQMDIVETLCMIDFYIMQTEEKNPSIEEVETYFEKLMNDPEDTDIAAFVVFEQQYMDEYLKGQINGHN